MPHAAPPPDQTPDARAAVPASSAPADAEPKPDTLAMLAVDANELARAIWSGQGTDVSRLVSDLLRDRPAA